jgi:cytochrome c oxidase assembly protein subunit 15
MTEVHYIPLLHRTAQLTVAATLLLIFMGGLVTSHGAGMSVPDWPNSYGYNMFTFPPSKWIGGIFYEHTHRLMGTVVGMLSIALVVLAWKYEQRRWVRWLTVGVLGAVIFQGVLGGLRVVLVELKLAVVHACFAQAFLCLAALVAVVTSRWWINAPDSRGTSPSIAPGRRLLALAGACALAIYLQLVAGAMMRHYEAGLAIPTFPLTFGKVLPPLSEDRLLAIQQVLHRTAFYEAMKGGSDRRLPTNVTMGQMWLHFGHRVGAVVVSAFALILIGSVLRHQRESRLRRPALLLAALLAAQLVLGVLTVLWRKPADVASLHVAFGALLLMTTFVVLVRAMRLYSPRWQSTGHGFELLAAQSTNNATLVRA